MQFLHTEEYIIFNYKTACQGDFNAVQIMIFPTTMMRFIYELIIRYTSNL